MTDHFSIVGLQTKTPFDLKDVASKPEFIIDLQEKNLFLKLGGVYVADPFIFTSNGTEYLFCELLLETNKGVIARLEREINSSEWKNPIVVLEEGFHLSYPIVFEHENNLYMTVESADIDEVRIYKSKNYKLTTWEYTKCLLSGKYYDPTIFKYDGYWFMFACQKLDFSELKLFYSESGLLGPWTLHPANPLISNSSSSRPSGPIMEWGVDKFRLAQDCSIRYGQSVKAFKINKLTLHEYKESYFGIILTNSTNGWNSHGMHHLQIYKRDGDSIHVVSDGYTRK